MMMQKFNPWLLIGFAVLYHREVQGFTSEHHRISKLQRSTVRYVKGFSAYEENALNGLMGKVVNLLDGRPQVGVSMQYKLDTTNAVDSNNLQPDQSFLPNLDVTYIASLIQSFSRNLSNLQKTVVESVNLVQQNPFYQDQLVQPQTTEILLGISLILSISIVMLMQLSKSGEAETLSSPYPVGRYNVASAKKYFERRKWKMLVRFTEIASASSLFVLKIASDYLR